MVPYSAVGASLVLLLANACYSASPKDAPPLTLAMGEITSCQDFLQLPIRAVNVDLRVNYSSGDMYMNSEIILEQPVDDPITLRMEVYKCISKEAGSCSLQQTLQRKTICEDIGKKGMLWTPILESVEEMESKCPLPVGNYKMIDAPITKAIRDSIPMNQGHWRLKVMLMKNGIVVGCFRGYGEVKPKRRPKG